MQQLQIPVPKERNLYLSKQVDQASIADLTKAIIEINEDDVYIAKIAAVNDMVYTPSAIKLYIDSYGGEAYQCFGLVGVIDNSKTPLHTIVTGCAMSAGFVVAISGHKRFAYNTSTFLYHQIGSGSYGKLKDLEDNIAESKRLQQQMETLVLSKTRLTQSQLDENYVTKTDWFLSANESLKFGIIDAII